VLGCFTIEEPRRPPDSRPVGAVMSGHERERYCAVAEAELCNGMIGPAGAEPGTSVLMRERTADAVSAWRRCSKDRRCAQRPTSRCTQAQPAAGTCRVAVDAWRDDETAEAAGADDPVGLVEMERWRGARCCGSRLRRALCRSVVAPALLGARAIGHARGCRRVRCPEVVSAHAMPAK
jgi:hypothetical protein